MMGTRVGPEPCLSKECGGQELGLLLQSHSCLSLLGVGPSQQHTQLRSRGLPPVLRCRALGVHGRGGEDTPETSWLRFCAYHACAVGGTSMLGGPQPVVPALPCSCCFGEGMRCRPCRVIEGAWEGVHAPGVGAHPTGGVPGGVWGDVQAHAGPSACTPAHTCRVRCTNVCVCVPATAPCAEPGSLTRSWGLLGLWGDTQAGLWGPGSCLCRPWAVQLAWEHRSVPV